MENTNKKIELTKELLEKTSYFQMKDLMTEYGIESAFKGGVSKISIIKTAMKMYADLKTAVIGNKETEITEPFTYTTDAEGNLTVIGEIQKELGTEMIQEGCDENCTSECKDCNQVSEKKEGRSIEEIEEALADIMSVYRFCIPSHKAHYGQRITEVEAELEEAKA